MAFLPIRASKSISDKYSRYLRTIFSFKDSDYQEQFESLLDAQDQFAAGPYLDVTDSFMKGKSIVDLIKEGLLSESFKDLDMYAARPLYLHQEKAIRKAFTGKNVVVSTGTGSGKTESFLIPVLAEIMKEHETNTLTPGIRALIIYPMNALANDQMERLRAILKGAPYITYGSYTGQTKECYKDAIKEYLALNEDQEPLDNELISREQMKESPPHILITNYAMLEYLMVRPDDSVFFEPHSARFWKYIILDEAHVYSGSTGIEVSMLLRRLKATLNNKMLQYVLTSATLGDDGSNNEVAAFASNLCDAPFSAEDVIRAERVSPLSEITKWALSSSFFREVAKAIGEDRITPEILSDYLPEQILQGINEESVEAILYELLKADETYKRIKSYITIPRKVTDIANYMEWSIDDAEQFVIAASYAEKDGAKLFDARYHMFLRATESVFVTLDPRKQVFLDRKNSHFLPDGTTLKVFEVGTCTYCHAAYIIGKTVGGFLVHTAKDVDTGAEVYLLSNSINDTDEDHTLEEEHLNMEAYELCPYCGFIRKGGLVGGKSCEHNVQSYVRLWKVRFTSDRKVLTKCPACETTNPYGILRMFFTGQEAVTSVIGTALFEALPSYKITHVEQATFDDAGFSFDDEDEDKTQQHCKESKQFLAFSDSRQAAAFYASYMDKTYRNILYKRVIVKALEKVPKGTSVGLPVLVDMIFSEMDSNALCNGSDYRTDKEAWKAILSEIIDNNGNTSLCKMGLMGISVDSVSMPGNNSWKLSSDDVRAIINEFIMGMLTDAAVSHPSISLSKADLDEIAHGGVKCTYTLSDSNAREYQKSFIPSKIGLKNKRVDYLIKIAQADGTDASKEKAELFLKAVWERLLAKTGIIIPVNQKYQVDANMLSIGKPVEWYICPKCKKLTHNNVHNVCPTYQCDGKLREIDPGELLRGNHYYEMYQSMEIRPLSIVEHSAQLSREKAYEYQKGFKRKEIDVLSCSTTFEMGVDVGSLETVFMRNMPPSPANYAQRAGRAGRSSKFAAFALTFCNKSNHDFTFFAAPENMIKGKILPPAFDVENDRIALRHVYASAMSFFWKLHGEYFKDAQAMLGDGSTTAEKTGMDVFIDYLKSKPEDLERFLKDFLPQELVATLGIETYAWADRLISMSAEEKGILVRAIDEYNEEVSVLSQQIDKQFREGKPVDYLRYRRNTYYKERIIAFLSRKGIFPRYGFPVDTVELSILGASDRNDLAGLQLQRDLSMAIAEYAPGSQIVANGNLITSRYIRKSPQMLWKMYDYKICGDCMSMQLNISVPDDDTVGDVCNVCGSPLSQMKSTFIIPEFGFIADNNITKPGLVKPERTFRGEICYIGKNETNFSDIRIGNAIIKMRISPKDEMAVINESNFFVCASCGYAALDAKHFKRTKLLEHKKPNGYLCGDKLLNRVALGYRFETNVVQLRFQDPALDCTKFEEAYSVLQGMICGFISHCNIDERDVSGTLSYYQDESRGQGSFAIVLYDSSPGGSGYVKLLEKPGMLEGCLRRAFEIVKQCKCGGEYADSSCYSCLRNYYNQRYHEELKRSYVVDFLTRLFE